MIKKTLTVTLQEKDPITKELHDIVELKRGNLSENIVLKFANPSGQLLVDKQDLYNGIREIELFYGDKISKFDLPLVVNTEASTSKKIEVSENIKPLVGTLEELHPVDKELEEAAQTVHIPIVYGEDGT